MMILAGLLTIKSWPTIHVVTKCLINNWVRTIYQNSIGLDISLCPSYHVVHSVISTDRICAVYLKTFLLLDCIWHKYYNVKHFYLIKKGNATECCHCNSSVLDCLYWWSLTYQYALTFAVHSIEIWYVVARSLYKLIQYLANIIVYIKLILEKCQRNKTSDTSWV